MSSSKTAYDVADLLNLMAKLRDPDSGCPWDIEQTYESITPSTIEEVYEVVDAIDQQDFDHLKEELGDLLFQVVFYTRIAEEEQRFSFHDVVDNLTAKLVRRHPHVFPSGQLYENAAPGASPDTEQVHKKWDEIKAAEREQKGQSGVLDDVPKTLPSIQRAQKMQKRVSKAGMDFRSVDATLQALEGEIAELREALSTSQQGHIEEEFGDVLFSCVNVARHLKLDSDHALRKANSKFEKRIRAMEALSKEQGVDWSSSEDEVLERLWREAKEREAER